MEKKMKMHISATPHPKPLGVEGWVSEAWYVALLALPLAWDSGQCLKRGRCTSKKVTKAATSLKCLKAAT